MRKSGNCIYDYAHSYFGEDFRFFPINDRQTPPPLPFKSGHIYMKNTQCAETNDESIFRFLVLRYGSSKFNQLAANKCHPKRCALFKQQKMSDF